MVPSPKFGRHCDDRITAVAFDPSLRIRSETDRNQGRCRRARPLSISIRKYAGVIMYS